MCVFLFISLLALALATPASAQSVTYGTFAHPFAATSIWNRKIAPTAKYRDANLSADNQTAFIPGSMGVHMVRYSDPVKTVYKARGSHFSQYCIGQDKSIAFFKVNLPRDLVVNESLDNGFHIFVYPDKSVRGGMGFERCSPTADPAQFFKGEAGGYRVDGDGLTGRHMGLGAAGLVSLGGIIRSGELLGTAPIAHALKVQLVHPTLYCHPMTDTKGFRWPAKSADSGACEAGSPRRYEGKNSDLEMGALLAMAPGYKCDALTTLPGRKICRAFQVYGGYVSDSCCNTRTSRENFWMLVFQIRTPSDRTVEKELRTTYNIRVDDLKCVLKDASQPTRDFKRDLDTVYNNLQVITNTSPQTPKG
jgi:hypothetical protein